MQLVTGLHNLEYISLFLGFFFCHYVPGYKSITVESGEYRRWRRQSGPRDVSPRQNPRCWVLPGPSDLLGTLWTVRVYEELQLDSGVCVNAVFTELVRLRFQQSGLILFCSSAKALASMVYILLSSFFIFFHLSPRMTLMALEENGNI